MTQLPMGGLDPEPVRPGPVPHGVSGELGHGEPISLPGGTPDPITETLDKTMFVEAGAGTGKTRALVDRMVALVCNGYRIERIAAITFTDRAAAELRERVRGGLEQKLAEDAGRADVVQAALDSLDRAQISTIHSFCQAIVRTYAAEAVVDPDFEVQDALMTQRRMQQRWREHLEHLGEDPAAVAAVDRLLSLGLYVNELEKLALELAARGEVAEILAARPPAAAEPPWPDVDAMVERLRFLHLDEVTPGDTLRARGIGVRNVLDAIVSRPAVEREEILAAGAPAFDPEKSKTGSKKAWGGDDVRQNAFDTIEETVVTLNDLLAGLRSAALAAGMPYIIAFVRNDERDRGREGALTFDDLILRARRLLASSAEAVRSLRSRYDALLIDEFQDTDPLQVQIATSFATDPATGLIEPGRLFLVGDPKQSIYRFRRADMATYAHTRAAMTRAGAELPQLTMNRRSRREILDWVNGVFGDMIGAGGNPDVQPPYVPIEAHRDIALSGPGVASFGERLDVLARVARVQEAEQVAALCRQAVEQRWQVAAGGQVREASYRDIAILMPRRIGLTALERALTAEGVPYRVEGGSLIFRTQEVRDLLNCLTAIDDPADEVAVVAALRSPAFACSDVDLARHRAAGRRFEYHRVDFVTPGGDPVVDGLRTLAGLHAARHEASLAALAERLVLDRGLVETGILDRGDRNSFRRARFMIERARAFEAAGPESLRAFVSWLESESEAAMIDNEGAGLDDDEDAVRVLTIHGAKGLEFPIVFLTGMAAAPNSNQPPTYTTDFTGERVAICVGTKSGNRRFILGDFDDLTAKERQHQDAEFDRMLYVAATRARDHLVVSLNHSKRAAGCAAVRVIEAQNNSYHVAPTIEIRASGATPRAAALANVVLDLPAGVSQENFATERQALVEGARTQRYTSATAIKLRKEEQKEEATDESEPWAHGRGGTRLGRAVHAAVQSLPLDADDAAIAGFAKAQAVAEAIPHREKDVEKLVRWIVRESEAWQRARAAKRAMREVPFALQSDGKVLEGFVDLVLQTDDGIEIVDWKTDQIAVGAVAERLAEYELQAGLYVHGLESATGVKVRRVTYVFASAKVEASPGEPGALANAARERLAAADL